MNVFPVGDKRPSHLLGSDEFLPGDQYGIVRRAFDSLCSTFILRNHKPRTSENVQSGNEFPSTIKPYFIFKSGSL